MREKIFIGSSKESLPYAKIVKKSLENEYDCVIWNDKFFELNKSTYENLYQKAYGFDYAIFIGGQDSIVYERRLFKRKTRDNVIFELGLYAGILSPQKTFFLLHHKCKVFSDFEGITINYFKNESDIQKCCEVIHQHMNVESSISRPSIMPATALAKAYYNNFLKKICKWLETKDPEIELNGKTYPVKDMKVTIKVLLPKSRIFKMSTLDANFYKKRGLTQVSVSYEANKRSLFLRVDQRDLEDNQLVIYDVPTILDASFDIVEYLSGKSFEGDTERILLLKKKEVRDFEKTLNHMSQDDKVMSDYLKCADIKRV